MDNKGRSRSYIRVARRPTVGRKKGEALQPVGPDKPPIDAGTKSPPGPAARGRGEERSRIVIPRQERGGGRPEFDVELREVRPGTTSRIPYLRMVPKRREFTRVGAGYFAATEVGSLPRSRWGRIERRIKQLALGRWFESSRLVHERLSKVKALAIFSSDALSSSAYATEEILLMLLLAGSGALHNALPIAAVITLLLFIVTASYRQTIKAYPGGGGAYIVAHENLGRVPGLTAGAALLVDYVLTVSVSVAAGVAAVTSAVPDLHSYRVPMGVFMIFLITWGNLRGIREAGTLFAVPTYFFIFSMASMIAAGLVKVAIGEAPGSLLQGAPPEQEVAATQGLTLFLILRAFSSGSAALTGIEAISNGVPAFKKPEVRNARATMLMMAGLLAFLFLGVTFLSSRFGLVPTHEETIVSKLGREVFGKNVLYYAYQVATALVLFLAANTSFNGFPPLAAILARDRFLPRQFNFRGDRLAYSNGIMMLAVASSLLIIAFGGQVTRLIPLYALGVFVSFTLSQAGMVRRFTSLQEEGWRGSVVISAVGAVATAIVAVIIGVTKFTHGAWISVLMMAALMLLFTMIRRHYEWFQRCIQVDETGPPIGVPTAVPVEAGGPRDHVIVPVDGVHKISLGAIGMARALSSRITAVHVVEDRTEAEEFRERWGKLVPDVPLVIIESPYRSFVWPMLSFIEREERTWPDRRIIVLLPTFKTRHWWEAALHNRDALRLRPLLKNWPTVRVVDFEYSLHGEGGASPRPQKSPA